MMERLPWLVCDIDGDIAGYAYASQFRARAGYRWSVELTVYVDSAFHRWGVGSALYTAVLLCLEAQGYGTAVAIISLPNDASVGLHESLGFRRTGVLERIGYKHGRWIDDGVWQKDLRSGCEPTEPLSAERLHRHTTISCSNGKRRGSPEGLKPHRSLFLSILGLSRTLPCTQGISSTLPVVARPSSRR